MKIAIASCARMQRVSDQTAWKKIRDESPDVLLLLGDNIYLDNNHNDTRAALAADLRARYKAQFEEPHFKDLLDTLGPMPAKGRDSRIFAIYDDHDFLGDNRYGDDTALEKDLRETARTVFVERFGRRDTFPRRMCSVTRGVGGLADIFILDGRFYRKPPTDAEKRNVNGMLGGAQWTWLEEELDVRPHALYTIIMSGTTFHDFGARHDSWSRQYFESAERLAGKLRDRPGAFVVSGDIHSNTASGQDGVVEIVSSAVATAVEESATGKMVKRANFGILTLDEEKMHVSLRRRTGAPREFTIDRSNWVLPPGIAVRL